MKSQLNTVTQKADTIEKEQVEAKKRIAEVTQKYKKSVERNDKIVT